MLFQEGGAVGHLSALADNKELTFAEIKEVITSAGEGRLEKASEKLDGINAVFTYSNVDNELRFARSGGDIKSGGMDAAALAQKFFGRGGVEEAFNKAFKVLTDAITSLPANSRVKIFGKNGSIWYSVEIIYTASVNTINYDGNSIVFHGWPVFTLTNDGKISHSDDNSGVEILSSKIEQMQKALTLKDWRIKGPSLVNMKKLSDGTVVAKINAKINDAMQFANCSDSNTLYDYLRSLMIKEIQVLKLPKDLEEKVVERCVEAPDALGVPALKKLTNSKEKQEAIASFVKSSESLVKKMMLPIENAITEFSIEVLKGIQSTLINDSEAEVQRLKSQVEKAIKTIENSGNQAAKDVLSRELERLKSVDNINVAMEGIVFFYKGNAYKFTGAFAAVHQILSLFKYGRKGIPKMEFSEGINKALNKFHAQYLSLINEGGHAFDEVSPITLDELKTSWPHIKKDLITLGCKNVEFIGSTGKKSIMGDIDLAATTDLTQEELFQKAKNVFGSDSAKKVGSNIVTITYPIYDNSVLVKHVQVDVMIGNTDYLKWSRFGTSTDPKHKDFSLAKGVVRNVLLNVVNRYAADLVFPGQQTELDRTKYIVDFDKGLYKVTQTRRNKIESKPPTKDWKTLSRTFVTDKPEKIAKIIFGKNIKANDLKKFEDVVDAIKKSYNLEIVANDIFTSFVKEIKEFVDKNAGALGPNPEEVISYIKSVVSK